MIRKLLIVAGVPLLIGLLVGGIAGFAFGPAQWRFAATAFALCVPPGVVALLLGGYLIRVHPFGRVLAVFVGTFVRLVVVAAGGIAVFLLAGPESRAERIAFWLWVLFAYLTTLAVETALLAGSFGKPVAGANAETGGGASHGG